jgi:hypothetical protein
VPAPFYTDQAAIVLCKLQPPQSKQRVLRRYVAHTPAAEKRAGSSWAIRLAKVEATT